MTSFVQAERNENDPCLALKCDKNSYCVIIPESQTAHCECNQGYTASGRSGCQDLDECSSGTHDCSENAYCINEEGSYKCQCQSGFVGDGKECIRKITCQDLNCHENAMCIERTKNMAIVKFEIADHIITRIKKTQRMTLADFLSNIGKQSIKSALKIV